MTNTFVKPATVLAHLCLALVLCCQTALAENKVEDSQALPQTDLFVSGEGGYNSYRIPALAVTKSGTLLAFCEGRKNSLSDAGKIDLLLRRSTDGGKTWSPMQVIWDDGSNTCGNPCVVVDQETGVIWLLSTWNLGSDHEGQIINGKSKDTRRVYVLSSEDDGKTWSSAQEITATTKKKNWAWYATGPGCGIQLEHGPHKGRLVIPCDHIEAGTKGYYSHVIYSDDHGKTWQLGGRTPKGQVNECEVVELTGGKMMLCMRNYDRSIKARQTAISEDGGATWTDQKIDPELVEPRCQASIRRLRWPSAEQAGVLLFLNPAHPDKREAMTILASEDDGETWPLAMPIYDGSSAYSCLCIFDSPAGNPQIGCFYERDNYRKITFTHFDWETLVKEAQK
ncbi:exo-alpha-sialidase [Bremerella cremea]|uniref:exo-alpha-sialidase n=1 Tax=Bremerella cremea TaxID=1031537 RepID=A0A368KLE1_9BACT|nr:sialidase family protein [Bremerella cremea]RCS41514.1 exo-alpha-sialidase [Bremerella cremea]